MTEKPFFPWLPRYSVGIDVIDNQHKELITHIDSLYQAIIKNKHKEESKKALKKLKDYTKVHFTFEKKLFEEFNYISTEEHNEQHQVFIDKIDHFNTLLTKNLPITFQMIQFLKGWITEHIAKEDVKFSSSFRVKEHDINEKLNQDINYYFSK